MKWDGLLLDFRSKSCQAFIEAFSWKISICPCLFTDHFQIGSTSWPGHGSDNQSVGMSTLLPSCRLIMLKSPETLDIHLWPDRRTLIIKRTKELSVELAAYAPCGEAPLLALLHWLQVMMHSDWLIKYHNNTITAVMTITVCEWQAKCKPCLQQYTDTADWMTSCFIGTDCHRCARLFGHAAVRLPASDLHWRHAFCFQGQSKGPISRSWSLCPSCLSSCSRNGINTLAWQYLVL